MGLRGLEPLTSSLSGKRSNRLSYRPLELTKSPGEGYLMPGSQPKRLYTAPSDLLRVLSKGDFDPSE